MSVTVAFVCVRNAGRSQMAAAFAQREIADRGLQDAVDLITGGTRPAAHVHEGVIDAMADVGVDISDRTPREITFEETWNSDYVITMGCSAAEVCPAGWDGETRDWDLEDPQGKPAERVADIREEISDRVTALFDDLETEL